ncbi:MAG: hypothetical protein KBA91_00545 [Candidatus Moranbacteria bacterium]|jgi:photosystem II stability/assembly factor-like uncharacterized protein|nr:hypothetical protein [Candidatus Moranbacteria bacterium]
MIKKSLVLVAATFLLSGCTVTLPFGTPVSTGPVDPTDIFNKKVQAGSVWKSTDDGQTFEVKSRVDEKQSITKADVLALSFHPTDPNTLYIGTVDHGIFKTTDAGETWSQIVFPPKKIYSFILDRNQPDTRMFASGSLDKLGKIFRTEDGGTTWRAVYTEPGQDVVITGLAQHPRDMNVIFAGTSAGTVVKSTDGGETWRNVGGTLDGPITDIAFDATAPLSVYAFSFNSKVYYSADGGVTWLDWEKVKAEEPAQHPGLNLTPEEQKKQQESIMPTGLLSITVDPSVSGRIYGSRIGGLYRSNSFGKYWEKINIIESAEKFPVRAVAVNPQDSNEVVFAAGSAFYKSKNAGETWAIVDLYIDRGVSVLAFDPTDSQTLYMALRKFK